MAKTQKKKVQMPAGIRNKLMAAVAMLLVSSIMVVSSTYAWFTLSTAPEVTGITTSVGANGNLEMALLNTDTYNHLDSITSAVGDSSQVKNVADANITWGNLVDMSIADYGLDTINLQPSRLNVAAGATKITAIANLLKTPVYGKDGRVATVDGTTYTSGSYNAGAWGYDADHLTYGVRAIGANDNLTAQQAGLLAAKAAYNTKLSSAKAAIQSALSTHGSELASAITTLAMNSTDVTLTETQKTAITAMISASSNALNDIDAAYKQVLLAGVSTLDATPYATAVAAINGAASYSAAVSALGATYTVPGYLSNAASALSSQKTVVSNASTSANDGDYKAALNALVDTTKVTVNGYKVGTPADSNYDGYLMGSNGDLNSGVMNQIIADGGAIVAMPDGSGVFAYVGSVAGNYSAGCLVTINYKGMNLNNMNATMKTTATVDATIGNGLKAITASSSGGSTTSLSDTYGYALDFAFRTNAASSYLQLQTAGVQRVYSDSTSVATQGGGSTMTFSAVTNDAGTAVLADQQIKDLMAAIRVAFINPESGDIYGIASLDNIAASGAGFKGDLTLKTYTVDANGKMTLTALTDNAATTDKNESVALMALSQNTAARLTAVVWLDGDYVDNGDVANAAKSLTGSMNLQFSSSAALQPMQNTALQNMTITYSETSTSGYVRMNGVDYKINTGYKIYNGSDNTLYYSTDESTYTKLTPANITEVGVPVTGSVTGTATSIETSGTATLTANLANATIKSVSWTSNNPSVATVAADADPATGASATVTGAGEGTAVITATITYTAGSTDYSVTSTYTVTVTAPAAGG